uniref:Transcription factor RF2a n=1 Tax=Anthurium amnicola TaxID=1678845 RepID=A0A1D1YKZ3_9ARAE
MAQLPPKIPNVSPNWPGFAHQRTTSSSMGTFFPTAATNTSASPHPSWVDEFLDFSAAKRGAHRRSASDSITFLEAPMIAAVEEACHRNGGAGVVVGVGDADGVQEFDRLDDDQLMSMFSDDIPPSAPPSVQPPSSNPSTPSDHNSINEEQAGAEAWAAEQQSQEAQSSCKAEPQQVAPAQQPSQGPDPIVDPKRVKRILANRQSAQRSRVRKLQYISELERSVTSLQTEVSALSPRVAFLDHQRSVLTLGNSALKQRIAALAQDKIFKDAHQEALKREIERLRQVYQQQNLKKMTSDGVALLPTSEPTACPDKELLMN